MLYRRHIGDSSQPRKTLTMFMIMSLKNIENLWSIVRARWQLRHVTSLGTRVRMRGRAFVRNQGTIKIGNFVCFWHGPVPTELTAQAGAQIKIGNSTMINYGCIINASKSVKVGDRCQLGYYVVILDSAMHRLEMELRHAPPESKAVIIEDDVWIGTRAIILPGVRIGKGSVVASGSIVTKDVPPFTVVAGVPAKPIKKVTGEAANVYFAKQNRSSSEPIASEWIVHICKKF